MPSHVMALYSQLKSLWISHRKAAILILSVISWISCITSVCQCTFFQHIAPSEIAGKEFGLFSRSVYDTDGISLGCVAYTDTASEFYDPMFRAGRAFGIISAVCGSLVVVFLGISLLFCPRGCDALWSSCRFYFAGATICQLFSFFVLNSRQCTIEGASVCTLSSIGRLTIFNTIVFSFLTLLLCFELPPKKPWLYWLSDSEIGVDTGYDEAFERPSKSEDLRMEDAYCVNFESRTQLPPYKRYGGKEQNVGESLPRVYGWQSHRSFRLLSTFFLGVTWALSVVGTDYCTLYLVGPKGGDATDFSGLGLFTQAAYYKGDVIGCLSYPSTTRKNFDSPFLISRVFGAISSFLLAVIFLLAVLLLFLRTVKGEIWLFIRSLLPCATVAQALVFTGFKTATCTSMDSVECRMGPTGVLILGNLALLTVLTIGAMLTSPPPGPLLRFHQQGKPSQSDTGKTINRYGMKLCLQTHGPVDQQPRTDSKTTIIKQNATLVPIRAMTPILEASESMADSSTNGGCFGCESISFNRPSNGDSVTSYSCEDSRSSFTRSQVKSHRSPESICVRVEYAGKEKKTIKTVSHADGSQTITTTIEEVDDEVTDVGIDDSFADGTLSYQGSLGPSPSDTAASALGPDNFNEDEEEEIIPWDPPLRPSSSNWSVNFNSLRQMFEK